MRLAPLVLALVLLDPAAGSVSAATQSVGAKRSSPITRLECEAKSKSLVSDTSLHLVFSNHTRGTVTIYWLDFDGRRVWYNTLAPGTSYSQQTYVTHPWIVVDAEGRCLEQLVPNAAGTFAVPI